VKDALKKTRSGNSARKRLQLIYDLCKNKKVCEGGDVMDTRFDKENVSSNKVGGIYLPYDYFINFTPLIDAWGVWKISTTDPQNRNRINS